MLLAIGGEAVRASGVTMAGVEADAGEGRVPFAGLRVAFTGRFEHLARREAEALVRALGGRVVSHVGPGTDVLVVGQGGWPTPLPEGASAKLRRAERLRERGHAIEILPESAFLRRLGLVPPKGRVGPDGDGGQPVPLATAARLSGLDEATVRRCVALGIVGDGSHERLGLVDVAALRGIAPLLEAGIGLDELADALTRLRRVVRAGGRLPARLRLHARDGRVLAALEGRTLTPDGQHLLPLDMREEEVRLEEALAAGLEAERAGDWIGAERWCRRALSIDPRCGHAWHNLGEALIARGRFAEAERCLRQAVRLLPELPQAWRTLGYVLDRLGRVGGALRALRRAVRLAPDYADGHMALAVVAERLGRRGEAIRHWRQCLVHAEDARMAALARRRLCALAGTGRKPGAGEGEGHRPGALRHR